MAAARATGAALVALTALAACGPRSEAPSVAAAAAAAKPLECLHDTWAGKIGDVPVHLNFEPRASGDGGRLVGRSYYRASLSDLLLERAPDGDWRELDVRDREQGRETGRLTLLCDGEVVRGRWRSPDGARTLAVALRRTRDDYQRYRLDRLQRPTRATAHAAGLAIEPLAFDNVVGLQVEPADARYERLNAKLWEQFVTEVEAAANCRGAGLLQSGVDHDYHLDSRRSLLLAGSRFVVVGWDMASVCPNARLESHADVLALEDGTAVDVAGWFVDGAFADGLEDRLRAVHAARTDPHCAEEATRFAPGAAWPTRKGMAFRPDAGVNCGDVVVLPYATIERYLSPAGRAALATFKEFRR